LWPWASILTARRAVEVAALAQSGQLSCASARTPKSTGGGGLPGSEEEGDGVEAEGEEVEGVEAEGVEGEGVEVTAAAVAAAGGGRDNVSATTLSVPAIC
jgi:hypothetical protein